MVGLQLASIVGGPCVSSPWPLIRVVLLLASMLVLPRASVAAATATAGAAAIRTTPLKKSSATIVSVSVRLPKYSSPAATAAALSTVTTRLCPTLRDALASVMKAARVPFAIESPTAGGGCSPYLLTLPEISQLSGKYSVNYQVGGWVGVGGVRRCSSSACLMYRSLNCDRASRAMCGNARFLLRGNGFFFAMAPCNRARLRMLHLLWSHF